MCWNLGDDRSSGNAIQFIIDTTGQRYKYQMGVVTPVVYTVTSVYLIIIGAFEKKKKGKNCNNFLLNYCLDL